MAAYTAYIGSFTYRDKNPGLGIYDVNVEKGTLSLREEVTLHNCTYLAASPDCRFLYAVVDEGVNAYRVEADGGLTYLNTASVNGLRGCYADVHPGGRFLAVGGYHDGKLSLLSVNEDGSLGSLITEYYNKGIGSVAERNFRPHVSCVQFTPCGRFLCMVDSGIDQIRLFSFDETTGSTVLCDQLHCAIGSGPHHLAFHPDGRHAYLVNELKNTLVVFRYDLTRKKGSRFEKLQEISVLPKNPAIACAACSLTFSPDGRYLFCSAAGENCVALFRIDPSSGLLTLKRILPISGEYPIDLDLFPDGRHLLCTNQESGTLTCFTVDYEKSLLLMSSLPVNCPQPNCLVILPRQE